MSSLSRIRLSALALAAGCAVSIAGTALVGYDAATLGSEHLQLILMLAVSTSCVFRVFALLGDVCERLDRELLPAQSTATSARRHGDSRSRR